MQTITPRKNIALQQGLTFGIALGIFYLITDAVSTYANLGGAGIVISIITIIAGILAYGFAGLRAAQATGSVGKGAIAGLFTGLFAGIISTIGSIIFTIMNVDTLRQRAENIASQLHLSLHYTNTLIISTAIGGAIFGLLIALGLGAGIGAIGGAIGKNRATTQRPTY